MTQYQITKEISDIQGDIGLLKDRIKLLEKCKDAKMYGSHMEYKFSYKDKNGYTNDLTLKLSHMTTPEWVEYNLQQEYNLCIGKLYTRTNRLKELAKMLVKETTQ